MIKNINANEIIQICKHARAIGLKTMQDLTEFIDEYEIKDKFDLINTLNKFFIKGEFFIYVTL